MTHPLDLLLGPADLKTNLFPPASRYHGIATARLEMPDGKGIVYLRRRFVPAPDRFALLEEHRVSEGERLDRLAARYLGDPEKFWQLCDANAAVRPDELVEEMGRVLRITLPEGIPGARHV